MKGKSEPRPRTFYKNSNCGPLVCFTVETHTFVWDGNNIVFEKVVFADDTVRTFEYFWGVDKSGTEQTRFQKRIPTGARNENRMQNCP